MPQPKLRRPLGAPTKIDDIVAEVGGIPVTAGERLIAAIRGGSFDHAAAGAAGLNPETFYSWLKMGADANRKLAAGRRCTANEKRYALFANEVAKAEAEAEVMDIGTLVQLGRGGQKLTTTTTKSDAHGNVVEIVTREETLPPNVQALTWHAERRWWRTWNRRAQLEITGADGGPVRIDSPLATLLSELDGMERRAEETAE